MSDIKPALEALVAEFMAEYYPEPQHYADQMRAYDEFKQSLDRHMDQILLQAHEDHRLWKERQKDDRELRFKKRPIEGQINLLRSDMIMLKDKTEQGVEALQERLTMLEGQFASFSKGVHREQHDTHLRLKKLEEKPDPDVIWMASQIDEALMKSIDSDAIYYAEQNCWWLTVRHHGRKCDYRDPHLVGWDLDLIETTGHGELEHSFSYMATRAGR